ncbi:MAG: PhzF family phenazine biosynthesis protein [Phycisphaerales bacterium]
MHRLIYIVDAFTETVFGGNPAAVVTLSHWPSTSLLQSMATEHNLSETAFVGPIDDTFLAEVGPAPANVPDGALGIRWFTPNDEMDLCGHATLAAAHVMLRNERRIGPDLSFLSRSGLLPLRQQDGGAVRLDFPARPPVEIAADDPRHGPLRDQLAAALGALPDQIVEARDIYAVYADAATVRAIDPDQLALARIDAFAVGVTAPGDEEGVDFVSRFFAPRKGVPEDPVTGSAHCSLAPYWGQRLGRTQITGRQVSRRGGTVVCDLAGDRVGLTGHCVSYLSGQLRATLPE